MASITLHPLSSCSSSLSTLRKSQVSTPRSHSFSVAQFQSQSLNLSKTLVGGGGGSSSIIKPLKLSPPPPHSSSSSTTTLTPLTTSAPQSLKSRIKNGKTLYGIFLLSFSPTIAKIACLSGYDFAVVDMEHGHGGISAALLCLHALAATQTPPP